MVEKILITSALPYANGPLHFGHIAGAYLPADTYARFQRLKDNDVLYICGSDEYGVAITLSAELANRTPQEHVDIFHEMNKKFSDDQDLKSLQIKAYVRYGIPPTANIPLSSLDLERSLIDDFLAGVKIHYPSGRVKTIKGRSKKFSS